MKNNPVFLGVYLCPQCSRFSSHNVVFESRLVGLFFAITGIPLTHSVKLVECSYCYNRQKLKKQWKVIYKRAVQNKFNDNFVVKRFIETVKECCIRHQVAMQGTLDENHLESAVDELNFLYGTAQGYSKSFYRDICKVYAFAAEREIYDYQLMFHSKL